MDIELDAPPSKLRKLSHDLKAAEPISRLPRDTAPSEPVCVVAPCEHSHHTESDGSASPDRGVVHEETVSVQSQHDTDWDKPDPAGQAMSKNQLKKMRRRAEWEAGREYRKAIRREKTAEKRKRQRAARDEAKASGVKTSSKLAAPSRPGVKPRPSHFTRLPIAFIIDCSFDDKMVEKERVSLGAQLTRCYSDNHKAPFQAHLVISSWGGLLKERFDTVISGNHKSWRGVKFLEEDFVGVAEMAKLWMTGKTGGKLAGVFSQYGHSPRPRNVVDQTFSKMPPEEPPKPPPKAHITKGEIDQIKPEDPPSTENSAAVSAPEYGISRSDAARSPPVPLPEPEIVYLTSDSPHTLSVLKPYSTYIVGGLVDKNRHKGICYKTAMERGIKTAKLPIGEFMEMQSRNVLATNHVVEIMLRWLEYGDWGRAFLEVIPKRKGAKLRTRDEGEVGGVGNDDKECESAGDEHSQDDGDNAVAEGADVVGSQAHDGERNQAPETPQQRGTANHS